MWGNSVKIVIVDDQTSARTMLRHILEDISPELEVFDFGDSEEALRWSENNRPDLLLLDYRMPAIDGLEFARAVARHPRLRAVRRRQRAPGVARLGGPVGGTPAGHGAAHADGGRRLL